MPAAILVFGIASIALLVGAQWINERHKANYEFIHALHEARVRTVLFHLWFEEAITERTKVDIEGSFGYLNNATNIWDAMVRGGAVKGVSAMQPLTDPELLNPAESMRILLAEFGAIAHERFRDLKRAGIGSPLDKQFNGIFNSLEEKYETIEALTWKKVRSDQAKSGRLFLGTVIIWGFIVAASAVGLWNREFRRKKAEEALQRAHGELEQRVEERTAELTGANKRLQQLSLQFDTLLNAIPDSLTLVSSELRVLWANRGSSSPDQGRDVSGQYCYTLLHGASGPCNDCPALRSFRTGKAENSQITKPDGRIWDLRAFPMRGDDGRIENVIEIATDITEKTTLQAETLRAAHLASIGELAAGVAHEINNPINGIINYAQIQLEECIGANADCDIPQRIMKEGSRIAAIVRSLLSFALERKEEKRPVRVHELLADTLALSGTQLRKDGIILKVDLPEGLPGAIVHSQQIQQVFLNIINNARYALNQKYPGSDENKILEILGEGVTCDGSPRVGITFHDRGIGIPADKINKVIEPFFTSKPRGVGTGLGLSISHGIVSDHGGKLLIQSVEGQFTRVQILLPAVGEG